MILPGLLRAAFAVAGRPSLWPTAFRQYRRVVPARWWRARPFLPLPDASYVRFRLLTQYGANLPGENSRAPEVVDVMNYLAWCRQWESAT